MTSVYNERYKLQHIVESSRPWILKMKQMPQYLSHVRIEIYRNFMVSRVLTYLYKLS